MVQTGVYPRDSAIEVGTPWKSRPLFAHRNPRQVGTAASFALWLPLVLTAIPTAWLWHRDRRLISSSPDHRLCLRCGYDLSGNTSGVCPECGEKTAMANSK